MPFIASLDYLKDLGVEIADESQDVLETTDKIIIAEKLHKGIENLTPSQQSLIDRVFFQEKSLKEIAAEEDVTYQAIQNRLNKILQKLKDFLS